MVYTAAALSLAALELFVNLDRRNYPANLMSIHALIPAPVRIESVDPENLPRNWRAFPAPDVLRNIGIDWLSAGRTAALSVPSARLPAYAWRGAASSFTASFTGSGGRT
jgi:hypothetical protein